MEQSIDEILADLRSFVGAKGREDNFLYSKVYAPSSHIRCVDFSQWLGKRLAQNDTRALAVFKTQASWSDNPSDEYDLRFNLADDGDDDELVGEEIHDEVDNSPAAFEREVKRHEQEIKNVLKFQFEKYFDGDIRSAKFDLLVAWLLGYSGEQFIKAMIPHNLKLKNAKAYLDEHNRRRKKQFKLPDDLPNDTVFREFQREMGKLPLATRLHVFDVFEYSGYGKSAKKKPLSDMTLYGTRIVGIDEKQSAGILRQSKLITSFPDETGFIAPEYHDSVSVALGYTKNIAPVYYEWSNEVASLLSDQLGVYFYDRRDPSNDGYLGSEESEE